jgi:NADH dehydrogenase [ubiquinone] 1 alpha subcomplex assembly factor 1
MFLGRMRFYPTFALFSVLLGSLSAGRAEKAVEGQMDALIQFEGNAGEPKWIAVNDGVMGGLSRGGPEVKDGSLHFMGTLSLENNGGFSSVRTAKANYDFSGKATLVMRVKGDGRKYQLRLATDARFNGSAISYGAEFSTEKDKWIEVKVPFEALSPSWRGRKLDGPPLDLSKVEELGLLIGDKKAGPFKIEVDWIAVE